MTAAQDLATAKTQADTTKTATATLLTNCITALASERAANVTNGTGESQFTKNAVAHARVLDALAAKIVYATNVDRAALQA